MLDFASPRVIMRRLRALVPLLVFVACDRQLHHFFESPPPPYIRLSVVLDANALTLTRGTDLTLTATTTRFGEDRGPVTITVEGAPAGVSATTKTSTTAGDVTTTVVAIHAATDAALGNYSLTVRAQANQAVDATSLLVLTVAAAPDFALATTKQALTIARGGIARVGVVLSRTNLPSPVSLSATSDPGITAQAAANPLSADTTTATIAVDPSVTPGAHIVVVHATAPGVAERTASMTVNVTADALQVLVQGDLTAPQLSAVSEEIIVNGSAPAGAVALSVEGLPANATATLDPLSGGSQATHLHLNVAATSPAGTYQVTVRARATGVPDATATLTLEILRAGIALSAAPTSAVAYTGSGAVSALTIARSNFGGVVALSADPLPAGLAVSFDSSAILGSAAKATITASSSASPGTYTVTLRATPVGLSAAAVQSASVAITVISATADGAVVTLDWSGCTPPDWVAFQDGSGPWARLIGSHGVFSGSMSSNAGAIAYVDAGGSLHVMYLTGDELTSHPRQMCAAEPGTRIVTGSGVHSSAIELGAYNLGNSTGKSSYAQPHFTIGAVTDGVHDLIAYSYFQTNTTPYRIVIRRDVTIGPGADSLAPVDFQSLDAFAPIAMPPGLTVSGPSAAGETFSHSINYLTTAACEGGLLYASPGVSLTGAGNLSFSLSTIALPSDVQRPDDYYEVGAYLGGINTFQSSTVAFHAPGSHSLQLAPLVPSVAVSAIPASFKRLQAAFGTVPPQYNRTVALTYSDDARSASVSASRAWVDATGATFVAMPDLSSVSGWPSSSAIPSGASGTWQLTLTGSSSEGSRCVEGRQSFVGGRSGQF
jgi:hypothetical protein